MEKKAYRWTPRKTVHHVGRRIFLGVKGTTSEMIIGAGTGIYRTRSIKRKPQEEKWNWGKIRGGAFGVPWERT